MKLKGLFFGLVVLFGVSSCQLDDGENFEFVLLNITDVELPTSFELNQTYVINVDYVIPDGCTYFENFDVTSSDNMRNVFAVGYALTEATCAQAVEEVSSSFNFRVIYDQSYVFRFYSGQDEEGNDIYMEYEIPVE